MSFTVGRAYELLQAAHQHQRLAHAYLITGAEGSGKRNLAVRLIELVNAALAANDEGPGLGLDVEPTVAAGGFDDRDVPVGPGSILYVRATAAHSFFEIEEDMTLMVFFASGGASEPEV